MLRVALRHHQPRAWAILFRKVVLQQQIGSIDFVLLVPLVGRRRGRTSSGRRHRLTRHPGGRGDRGGFQSRFEDDLLEGVFGTESVFGPAREEARVVVSLLESRQRHASRMARERKRTWRDIVDERRCDYASTCNVNFIVDGIIVIVLISEWLQVDGTGKVCLEGSEDRRPPSVL